MARSDAPPIQTPTMPDPPEKTAHETTQLLGRVDALEKEKLQLQIDRAAKEQVIGIMVDERRGFIDQLTTQGREIGRLEMQVRQLAAPKDDVARHDAPAVAEVILLPIEEEGSGEIEPEPVRSTATPSEPTKRVGWWRR